ncbi:MAG TPA: nuclear transport factor 2 family protein [Solirubrobacterales bacterium]|nr:nuclear transport factor 2 family protein [Solirubrobacterales bacterium]
MPETNAQRIRAAYEALSRRDVHGLADLLDPDVEFRNPDYAMETGIRHGRAEFIRALERGWEVIEDTRYEVERIVEDGDVYVVIGFFTGRGVTGGVPVSTPFGHVLELRDERAISVSWFQDPAEALAVAGISER